MDANGASPRVRSEVCIPQRDCMASSPSPVNTREEPVQAIPLQLRPLQGPPRPTETLEDTTPNGAIVTKLLHMVQRQTLLIKEQNRRWQIWNGLAHQSDLGGFPLQPLTEEEGSHVLPVPDPLDTPSRHDRDAYDPFTRRVQDAPIPRELEKPPQMNSYDGTTDPDEHIVNIEAILIYRSMQGVVKCKLFVTTPRRGVVILFKNLRRNSIDSWSDLCHEFTTHFTASRTQPKTVASLEAIVQGKSEPL